jgi:hypothetical protein
MPSEPGLMEFGRMAMGWNTADTLNRGGGTIR